jgi:hypothetical protein
MHFTKFAYDTVFYLIFYYQPVLITKSLLFQIAASDRQ